MAGACSRGCPLLGVQEAQQQEGSVPGYTFQMHTFCHTFVTHFLQLGPNSLCKCSHIHAQWCVLLICLESVNPIQLTIEINYHKYSTIVLHEAMLKISRVDPKSMGYPTHSMPTYKAYCFRRRNQSFDIII